MGSDGMQTTGTAAQVAVHAPGSDQYVSSTSPHNPSGVQQPAAVVVATSAAEVAAAMRLARDRGWSIAPQATGHGAAGDIGADTLLLDTSALADVVVDPPARARAGAGAVWSSVQAEAQRHGVLGLAGTSSSVGVAGYTFGGGVGWLARPWGLASGRLTAVDFVDGEGRVRRATEDAADEGDRDALWAFRGGEGAAIATALEFDLVEVPELWSGYLLWAADDLEAVVSAWTAAMASFGPALTTTISVLHAPPGPPFPPELQGQAVVHLALASTRGESQASALFDSLGSVTAPVVSTWGPSDAEALATIHLDPPPGTAALGGARWLDGAATDIAAQILRQGLQPDSPLLMVEIRHVDSPAAGAGGAMTTVPGPLLVHAVGGAGDPGAIDAALERLWAMTAGADTGRVAPPFAEGRRSPGTGLDAADSARITAIRAALDPHGIIRTARLLP